MSFKFEAMTKISYANVYPESVFLSNVMFILHLFVLHNLIEYTLYLS
jgi:hypothetical protein